MTVGTMIRELISMPVVGNAYHDMPLFKLADKIIRHPEATRSQQLAALRQIDRAMGYDMPVTDQDITDYINACE